MFAELANRAACVYRRAGDVITFRAADGLLPRPRISISVRCVAVWLFGIVVAIVDFRIVFYIIGGQYLISKLWKPSCPFSGYATGLRAHGNSSRCPSWSGSLVASARSARWGTGPFFSREEINATTWRTARAKGLSEYGGRVVPSPVLRNAMIPILTGAGGGDSPLLFLGSLITESFFSPFSGPGPATRSMAINNQDFAVVRRDVFPRSVLYIVGLILTDISPIRWPIRASACNDPVVQTRAIY